MRTSGALCALLSTFTIQVLAAAVVPPTAQAAALPAQGARPQYVPLPVYVQVPGPPGTEPSYAQLYAPANSQTPAQFPAPITGQIPAAPGIQLPASTGAAAVQPPAVSGSQLVAPPGPQIPAPVAAAPPAVAAAPINTTLVATPAAVAPNPSAELECKCPAGQSPMKFAGLCICGDCGKVSPGVKSYTTSCPDSKFAAFNQGLEKECKEIENTEDCEFFKKSPGALTDDYKRCRDQLDSIMDDCENDAKCCSTMVKPGEPAPVDD